MLGTTVIQEEAYEFGPSVPSDGGKVIGDTQCDSGQLTKEQTSQTHS